MIQPLRFMARRLPVSPFEKGPIERPLVLTLDSASFADASEDDKRALQLIRELGQLPSFTTYDTLNGPHSRLSIEIMPDGERVVAVRTVGQPEAGVVGVVASELITPVDLAVGQDAAPDLKERTLTSYLLGHAHAALGGDLFVTACPPLVKLERDSSLNINARSIWDAGQIVGLLLRSRGDFTSCAAIGSHRWLFYWAVVRSRLPTFWPFFSKLQKLGKVGGRDVLDLGQTVMTRCSRALEARDLIGEQFYQPQGNDTADRMLYHFDYLTVLLSGAFDAMARLIHVLLGFQGNILDLSFRDIG